MGGLNTAIFDLLFLDTNYSLHKLRRRLIRKFLIFFSKLIIYFSIGLTIEKQKFTTGYGLVIRKKL